MKDMKLVNKKVSNILKNDNNEVVYKAWLYLTESAELEENNIVINVPNYFIKETMEERYASEIEELYRNELGFSKLIVRVANAEPAASKTKDIQGISDKETALEYINNKFIDMIERINSQVRKVYEFVEVASNSGDSNISLILSDEPSSKEEIYFKVKEFLLEKGFKAELFSSGNDYTLNLSW